MSTSEPAAHPLARRLLYVALLAAMGAAAWWAARREAPPTAGLRVHIEVLDREGQPVSGAQAAARFVEAPWQSAGDDGRVTLRGVILQAGATPSPASIEAAIDVRAPYFTRVGDAAPELTPGDEGSWRARYVLEAHGVLELRVADTSFGEVKGTLEPDRPLRRWSSMGAHNVARAGQAAHFRVHPDLEVLHAVVAGVPTPQGEVLTSTRRIEVPAPRPGTTKTVVVRVAQARPIFGRIALAEGPRPPQVSGTVAVVELGDEGVRTQHAEVPLSGDGSFVVPYTGEGAYELTVHSPYLELDGPVVAQGGVPQEIVGARLRPWLVLTHPPLDVSARTLILRLRDGEGPAVRTAAAMRRGTRKTTVPLARAPERLVLEALVPGQGEHAPLHATHEVRLAPSGPTTVDLRLVPMAQGALTLQLDAPGEGRVRGASVSLERELGGERVPWRRLSWRAGSRPQERIEGLAAGRYHLEFTWRDPTQAHSWHTIDLAPQAAARLSLRREPGAVLRRACRSPADFVDESPRLLRLEQPTGLPPIPLERGPGRSGWRSAARLPAGSYVGTLAGADVPDETIRFVIDDEALAAGVVALDASPRRTNPSVGTSR